MTLPKLGEKKNCFGNCGDGIAENVKKKKIDLAIVAMPLPKMKKKICFVNCGNGIAENGKKKKNGCSEICEKVKKKVVTYTIFLQYFHNKSHVINYY